MKFYIALVFSLLLSMGAVLQSTSRASAPFDQTLWSNQTRQSSVAAQPTAGALIISEFRVRGPGGADDEFIEIYNNTGTGHTVTAAFGTGYGIAASDGVLRCTIPNGTLIPAAGHYLCVNSDGYSLFDYPAGNGTTATGNATYVTDIPDNAGIALFNNNSGGASFSLANRFDAVGSDSEANSLYKEGTGYPSLVVFTANYCFFRKFDLVSGLPTDTDNNATDFLFTDPNGSSIGAGRRLGAPGPQNLSSPVFGNVPFPPFLIDSTKAASALPNRLRDTTPDPGNNSTLGTMHIRRRFVNNTGLSITKLRFRVINTSTSPQVAGMADLRLRTSNNVQIAGINDSATCSATGNPAPPCTVSAQGTFIETPPNQPFGGGFNSSAGAGTVTPGTPIANGASINLVFLFGVQQNGNYHLVIELEALPNGRALFQVSGNTSGTPTSDALLNRSPDYDGDGKTDISVYRPSTGTWHLQRSLTGYIGVQFGISTDKIVPADYDGDGKTDIAVYRPSTGYWYIMNSLSGTVTFFPFGIAEDLPAPADYDGDGKADATVFRPSTGTWYRLNSSNGSFFQFPFGTNGDKPAIGDFDGDGKADISVYRPSTGSWYRINSSNGAFFGTQFGISSDLIVPGDYDGDAKTDVAVFRPSTGFWFRLNSSNGSFVAIQFGLNGDNPAPGDFDGDGKTDLSVFRPTIGTWYRLNSSTGSFIAFPFGASGDLPTPSAFRF